MSSLLTKFPPGVQSTIALCLILASAITLHVIYFYVAVRPMYGGTSVEPLNFDPKNDNFAQKYRHSSQTFSSNLVLLVVMLSVAASKVEPSLH